MVDAVLLQPPPFPEPERLVTLWETDPENGNRPAEVASANFLDWREQATSFEHVAALDPYSRDLTGADEPEVLYGWQVTEGFFEALGAGAAHGRTFLPDEHRPGSGVVVMTDELWRRRFAGDPAIIGRTLVLDDEPHTVVGVLAPSFELRLEGGRSDRDIFLPKAVAEYETYIRSGGWWQVVARTRPDVTLAEAQAEMDAVAGRLAADHPRTNAGGGARVIPLQTRQVAAVRPVLLLLWGAVVFVLLIACVNVANLTLARYARREQEFAVRAAVGGEPARLLRQLLTESVVIAALGGLGGLVATAYALDLLVALMPADVPRLAQIAVNERLLGFTAGLVVLTALAFGCAPAVRILRQDVNGPLTRGRRAGDTPAQQRLRRTLVAAEVALALVLLVGAGLLMQSFVRLVNGVIAVATAQRTREIGLRLAMGAEPRNVVWMVVRGAVGLAAAGVAVGLLASLLFSQTLTSLLFDVAPFDAVTLAGVSLLLLAVAAAAAWSPARRASRVDPLVALRSEATDGSARTRTDEEPGAVDWEDACSRRPPAIRSHLRLRLGVARRYLLAGERAPRAARRGDRSDYDPARRAGDLPAHYQP